MTSDKGDRQECRLSQRRESTSIPSHFTLTGEAISENFTARLWVFKSRHCKFWCVDSSLSPSSPWAFLSPLPCLRSHWTTHKGKLKKLWKSSEKEIFVDVVGKFEKGLEASLLFLLCAVCPSQLTAIFCLLISSCGRTRRKTLRTAERRKASSSSSTGEERNVAGALSINLHDKRSLFLYKEIWPILRHSIGIM